MSKDGNNLAITHKELLAFSNLTNLKWEFVDLTAEAVRIKGNGKNSLDDLLDPEVFAEKDEDGQIEKYSYMKNVKDEKDITEEDREKGKGELRKHAGIAMEYLEKWQRWQDTGNEEGTDEGSFLGDWEVIYGADNYKVIADFFDDLYAAKYGEEPDANQKPYSSRGELDDKEKAIETFEIITTGINIASKFLPIAVKVKFADKILGIQKTVYTDDLFDDVLEGLEKVFQIDKVKELDKMLEGSKEHWALASIYYSSKVAKKLLKGNEDKVKSKLKKDLTKEQKEKIARAEEYPTIYLTKKLDMSETDFRVLAFNS